MSYKPDTITRAEMALKRGKLQQAWHLFAEAENECNSKNKQQWVDRRLQRVESRMRSSKRFMRELRL